MATRVTNYFTANGRIRAERTAGFPGHDYIPDGLRNVTATASPTTQDLQYFARYLPYGRGYNLQTTNTLPAFRWVGALGYRTTGRRHADEHVRARHFSWTDGRWTAADPLWPQSHAYSYGLSTPIRSVDPSGLLPFPCTCCWTPENLTFSQQEVNGKDPCNNAPSRIGNYLKVNLGAMVHTSLAPSFPFMHWWECNNVTAQWQETGEGLVGTFCPGSVLLSQPTHCVNASGLVIDSPTRAISALQSDCTDFKSKYPSCTGWHYDRVTWFYIALCPGTLCGGQTTTLQLFQEIEFNCDNCSMMRSSLTKGWPSGFSEPKACLKPPRWPCL